MNGTMHLLLTCQALLNKRERGSPLYKHGIPCDASQTHRIDSSPAYNATIHPKYGCFSAKRRLRAEYHITY